MIYVDFAFALSSQGFLGRPFSPFWVNASAKRKKANSGFG
jgi:hypothetical protein